MTINPASLPTVPPATKDAMPMQVTVGELPVGAAQKVGDYKILGTLGSGGMGIVYKAFDQKIGRVVALKMLQVGRDATAEEVVRFRSEAEMLGRLQHPNIVQVFDFGVHEGVPYIVMEFVNGGSLDKRLQGTPQPPRRAAEWMEQIARAVQVAHDNKVLHRDLKPGNVLLTTEGTPKITDFGLAKRMEASHGLTQTGALLGTPSYMSPEQAQGKKDLGAASDVYSLGAILYECLTGRPPFRGATLQETLEQVCHADPAPPSRLVPRLPRDLQTVCLKCLHKAPGRRYATAHDLADDLKSFLEGLPVKARPTHSFERLVRIVARRPLHAALALCAVLMVAMAVFSVMGWYAWSRETSLAAQKILGQEQEKEHKAKIEQLEKEKLAQTREEADQSLETLNRILAVALEGKLKDVPGLEPLFAELRVYYDRLIAGIGTKEWVDERKVANACYNLGRLYRKRGEYAHAQDAFEKADRLFLRVNAGGKASAESRYEQARARMERGQVNGVYLGAWDKADADLVSCIEQTTALLKDDPKNQAYQRLLGELHHSRGMLLGGYPDRDNRNKGAEEYSKALAVRTALVNRPEDDKLADDKGDLARTYGWQGDLFLELGDPVRADTAYRRSYDERKKLAEKDRDDDARQFQLSRGLQNFGVFLTRVRALATAKDYFEQAMKMVSDLIERKRITVADYKGDQTSYRNWIVELSLLTLDGTPTKETLDNLLATCDLNLRELDEAIRQDATSLDPQSNKALCLVHRARVLSLLNRQAAAMADLDEAKRLFDALAAKRPSSTERYALAAALAMKAGATESRRDAADLEAQALKALGEAFKLDYRRLHVEDVRKDVAFAKMAKNPDFDRQLRDRAGELHAAKP